MLFQKMATFTNACEESVKKRRMQRMQYGIQSYRAVTEKKEKGWLGYLLPLRHGSHQN